MTKLTAIVLTLVLAACGSKAKPAAPTQVPASEEKSDPDSIGITGDDAAEQAKFEEEHEKKEAEKKAAEKKAADEKK